MNERGRCENRPAMTHEQAIRKVELFGRHRFRLEPYECDECGRWHLRSHWKDRR